MKLLNFNVSFLEQSNFVNIFTYQYFSHSFQLILFISRIDRKIQTKGLAARVGRTRLVRRGLNGRAKEVVLVGVSALETWIQPRQFSLSGSTKSHQASTIR